jgi:hypothetical protein
VRLLRIVLLVSIGLRSLRHARRRLGGVLGRSCHCDVWQECCEVVNKGKKPEGEREIIKVTLLVVFV